MPKDGAFTAIIYYFLRTSTSFSLSHCQKVTEDFDDFLVDFIFFVYPAKKGRVYYFCIFFYFDNATLSSWLCSQKITEDSVDFLADFLADLNLSNTEATWLKKTRHSLSSLHSSSWATTLPAQTPRHLKRYREHRRVFGLRIVRAVLKSLLTSLI